MTSEILKLPSSPSRRPNFRLREFPNVNPKLTPLPFSVSHLVGHRDISTTTHMIMRVARINEKWWEHPAHTMPDFLTKNDIYHKEDVKHDISALKKIVAPKENPYNIRQFFTIPDELPSNFTPQGRFGQFLKRDEEFFRNTKAILKEKYQDVSHSFFINFTGHQGSIGAALSEVNIPVFWQVIGDDRIINSLQDWKESFIKNDNSNNTNAALLLEPSHWIPATSILFGLLPQINTLKENGIKHLIVFTELLYGRSYSLADFPAKSDPPFLSYIQDASKHLEVIIEGTDYEH